VRAMADIQLAKSWLNDCVGSHKICPKSLNSRLPSRILDLGPPEGTSDLRLLVNVNTYGCYATLSHCWGKSQPLKLTKTTYDKFQKKITYISLPKTFQDAVTATRSLGLRYLWIDSLCIIQGCKRDWEEQCTEMRRIYKDSFVTLAGPAASGCHSGFLDARQISPHATLQASDSKNSSEVVLSYSGVSEDLGDLMPEPNSVLSKRAWVLQERLLSSRVLYFGTKRMYLECFTNVRFEDCHYPINWEYQIIDMVEKLSIDSLGTHLKCFEYWTGLVQTYSETNLTNATDRLPALSGLASEFQRVTEARYLAGIWREDMPRALAWYVPFFNAVGVPPLISVSDYIAPSWSWASAKLGVLFANGGYENQFYGGLDIIDAGMTLVGLDPFGAVEGGYIDVSGSIQTLLVQQLPDLIVPGRRTLYLHSSNSRGSILATYAPDDVSKVMGPKFKVLMLYLGRYSTGQIVAMAIEPVDGQCNTYRRIGLAYTGEPGYEEFAHYFRDIFRDVGQSLLRLI